MAGEADLQPSKSAKNAATCGKKQGAGSKKKKQSCSNNETSHNEKKVNDNCGNDNEKEVLKMNDDKFSDMKETVIEKHEKCNVANHDKGSLYVHKRKDALNKETDSFVVGEECSSKDTKGKDGEVHCKIDSNDVIEKKMASQSKIEKEMINVSKIEGIDRLGPKNQVMIKEKVVHSNNESHKKENKVKAISVDKDEDAKKKAKESVDKEDCVPGGGNDLSSTEEKDSSNIKSPKKRQFGYNNRGRGSYGHNRGRNFNWWGGWGHNNRYPNQRMMNPSYRGHNRPCNNYNATAPGHLQASSPVQPEVPPPAFIGSLQPVYFESQMKYQDCFYFPQVWPPQQLGQMPPQQTGQTLFNGTGTTTFYQGCNDIPGAQANTGQTELASSKPYNGDDKQRADMSKEKAGTKRIVNLDHQNPAGNQSETSNQMNTEANQAIAGPVVPSNIIASVSSNPLFELGKSVEQDKQLVQAFAGIEMRPSVQLPPDYGLQWFFIQYGAKLPPSVIPVMVVPFLNAAGGQNHHPGQDGSGGQDLFPSPQSLLPSYFSSGHVQSPSPVDIYQPAVNAWPNQTMNPMAAGNQECFIPQTQSSQNDFHAENNFQAK